MRTPLFTMRRELYLAPQENYTPFDISHDGQRFLMARTPTGAGPRARPLVVTENWLSELRAQMQR